MTRYETLEFLEIRENIIDMFVDMDPLMYTERLAMPDRMAIGATVFDEKLKEERPAGLMMCIRRHNMLFIEWLAVRREYRVQGIGEALLIRAFEAAQRERLPQVCAYMNEEYGRGEICPGDREYFMDRLFQRQLELPGEWELEAGQLLKKLSAKETGEKTVARSLQSVGKTEGLRLIEELKKEKNFEENYDLAGHYRLLSHDESFLYERGGRIKAAIFLQRAGESLYQVGFYAENEEAARIVIKHAMSCVARTDGRDATVRFSPLKKRYGQYLEKLAPGKKIRNYIMAAEVSAYEELRRLSDEAIGGGEHFFVSV